MNKMFSLITKKNKFQKKIVSFENKRLKLKKICRTEQQKFGFKYLLAIENIKINIIIYFSILTDSDPWLSQISFKFLI
jgi:hypothetical protein